MEKWGWLQLVNKWNDNSEMKQAPELNLLLPEGFLLVDMFSRVKDARALRCRQNMKLDPRENKRHYGFWWAILDQELSLNNIGWQFWNDRVNMMLLLRIIVMLHQAFCNDSFQHAARFLIGPLNEEKILHTYVLYGINFLRDSFDHKIVVANRAFSQFFTKTRHIRSPVTFKLELKIHSHDTIGCITVRGYLLMQKKQKQTNKTNINKKPKLHLFKITTEEKPLEL